MEQQRRENRFFTIPGIESLANASFEFSDYTQEHFDEINLKPAEYFKTSEFKKETKMILDDIITPKFNYPEERLTFGAEQDQECNLSTDECFDGEYSSKKVIVYSYNTGLRKIRKSRRLRLEGKDVVGNKLVKNEAACGCPIF